MPANLPPQYYEAERRFRFARTPEEKIVILKEMMAIMPKHKGTDKLQADLRKKLSELNKEVQRRARSGKRKSLYHIPREGVAQAVLLGMPNTGKSQILATLTNARPEVADYPFTTQKPLMGMMDYEDIKIQIVDTPPVREGEKEPWLVEVVQGADLVLLVVDLSREEVISDVELPRRKLEDSKIKLVGPGNLEEEDYQYLYKKTILVGNKADTQRGDEILTSLKDNYSPFFPIIPISPLQGYNLEELKRGIYQALDIVRIYTKEPGKPPDKKDPLVLPRGSTVLDAARALHKDFLAHLKYARLWGSNKYGGQRVEKGHILKDGDVVEFHV